LSRFSFSSFSQSSSLLDPTVFLSTLSTRICNTYRLIGMCPFFNVRDRISRVFDLVLFKTVDAGGHAVLRRTLVDQVQPFPRHGYLRVFFTIIVINSLRSWGFCHVVGPSFITHRFRVVGSDFQDLRFPEILE